MSQYFKKSYQGMANILQLNGVVKRYGNFTAVDHIHFEMPEGVIFGMLGPNGAGKTSLIRIITTIVRADAGEVWFDGERLNSRHPEHIGYMPEERGLYKKMKVGEQLTYLARLKGLSPTDTRLQLKYWFERFDIRDWWGKKVEELSKGMQQKVQFIATVLHRPKLLILDEPFSGLDPINSRLLEAEIRELNRQGASIIFSTHRMEQVEEICDHIVLINQGKNILQGEVAEVKQRFKEHLYRIQYEGDLPPAVLDGGAEGAANFNIQSNENQTLVVKVGENNDSNKLLRHLIRQNVPIRSFHEMLPTINEIFIRQVSASV